MKLTDFAGFFRDFFSWLHQMHQTKKSVEKLESEVDRISKMIEKLIYQAEHAKEIERLHRETLTANERHEREKLLLQLQNILTQFENRLPPKD